jgi:2-polyprenyl-3-methyl-5-hydroxy-6-metoxy-1,4-benzoquinol methylase
LTTWSRGTLEAVSLCPVCGCAARNEHAASVFDHLDRDSLDRWSVWRCLECRSIYLDPRPDASSLPLAYTGYYTHDEASDQSKEDRGMVWSMLWALINGYLNARFAMRTRPSASLGRFVFPLFPPFRQKLDYHCRHLFSGSFLAGRRSLLDVGCGNGEFLLRARAMGWNAEGIDPDRGAVEACLSVGLDAKEGFIFDLPPAAYESFDVITLRHAIEHTPNPGAMLDRCFDLLAPGGMLWLAWPNPEGPGSSWFKAAWRGLEVPRHLCIPSRDAAFTMLQGLGFKDIRFLKRGIHARSIFRASVEISRHRRDRSYIVDRWLAPFVRAWSEIRASISSKGGEELVVIARKSGAR